MSTIVLFSTSSPQNVITPGVLVGFLPNFIKSWNAVSITLASVGILFLVVAFFIFSRFLYLNYKEKLVVKHATILKEKPIRLMDDDFEDPFSPYGYIEIAMTYHKKIKKLKIQDMTIYNMQRIGRDIPDYYIKIYMKTKKGNKYQKHRTKTIRDNLNPKYPEVISLKIEDLVGAVVYFEVIDENNNGNDYPVGDGKLVIDKLVQTDFIGYVYNYNVILEKPKKSHGCGEVCIIISYFSLTFNITILEAKNLIFKYNMTENAYPSVYATVKVFVKNIKKKTFTTRTITNTRDPYFLESFNIPMNMRDVLFGVFKVEIFEYITGRIPKRIGRTCIGNKTFSPLINELGAKHLDLLSRTTKRSHPMWHSLIKG